MTKTELQDKFFHEFLIWCSEVPANKSNSELVFWLNNNAPTESNFWLWLSKCKKESLKKELND